MTTSVSSATTASSAAVLDPPLARFDSVSVIPPEKLAVTLLVPAIAAPAAAVDASVTVTVDAAASTTSLASVTSAAVTSAVVPLTV